MENWIERNREERDTIILKKIEEDKWIIDGTYFSTLEQKLRASDVIIFLNYSTFARFKGVFSRYFKNRNKEKKEIPGCKETMTIYLLKQIFAYTKKSKKILNVLKNYNNKNIIIFKNRQQLNSWYEEIFKTKIDTEI